jgi:hypothetical protein
MLDLGGAINTIVCTSAYEMGMDLVDGYSKCQFRHIVVKPTGCDLVVPLFSQTLFKLLLALRQRFSPLRFGRIVGRQGLVETTGYG